MAGQLTLVLTEERVVPTAVWESLPPGVRTAVTVMLARLLTAMVQEARDE
jgi:hypothetical protein